MLRNAIRQNGGAQDQVQLEVIFLMAPERNETARFKAVCGPGDQGEPVITIMRSLVKHLVGTKRMLMFDEVDCASHRVLEWIRELHDATGCGVLLLGKPTIYQKLGFRDVGDFRKVTDQLASRVVIRRDLTERTRRADHPEPLFSKDDIRKLIKVADLHLKVSSDAVDWLQDRACVLGMGGFGMAVISLYLAYKFAVGSGAAEISAEHLEAVEQTTIGHEEVERVEEIVAAASGKRIRRFG